MRSTYYSFQLCIAVVLLFYSFRIEAQTESDSVRVDSAFIIVFDEADFLLDSVHLSKPVSHDNVQRYQLQFSGMPYLRVGNPGHAMYSPLLSYLTGPLSLSGSVNRPYLPYFDQRESMRYYRNSPPVTTLSYMSGAKKEEAINVLHSRNVGDNLNVSLHLDRNASLGFYNHLKTRTAIFNMNVNYSTKNQRYTLMSHYYVNRKELEENGGFENFSLVENPETLGSSRLNTASNDVKEEGVLISQTIGFGNTAKENAEIIRPLFRLGYDFQYLRGYRKYLDEGNAGFLNTDYYDEIYFDSTRTSDNVSYDLLHNQLNFFLYPGNERIKFYYANELITYDQNEDVDTVYTDHISGTDFALFLFKRSYKADIKASYVFDGFREGDMNALIDFYKRKSDTTGYPSVLTTFYHNLSNPQFRQLRYTSNNYIWANNFRKTQRSGFKVGIEYKGIQLTADAGILSDYIYYDINAKPVQYDERINYTSVGLKKLIGIGNFFLDNNLMYQSSSAKTLPVPTFMVQESVYFQNYMFKKVIQFRVGFDVYYFTGFNGLSYSPVLGEFHLQNDQIIGNYPFIDLFFTFQLKRAFFFIKFEHVNKGMTGDSFYNVPNYPVPARAFKWGLKWYLFD